MGTQGERVADRHSPPQGVGGSLEGAHHIICYPAGVEAALLWCDGRAFFLAGRVHEVILTQPENGVQAAPKPYTKTSHLRLHAFAVHAALKWRGIEGQIPLDATEAGCRILIRPYPEGGMEMVLLTGGQSHGIICYISASIGCAA